MLDLELVTSEAIEAEYLRLPKHPQVRKLLARRDITSDELLERLARVLVYALPITPTGNAPLLPRDPDDEKFLHCAISSGAEGIVTADKDFATVAGSIQIFTAAQFVQRCRSAGCCNVDRWASYT